MEQLSESENTILGGSAAFVGVLCLQPTLYWKNSLQRQSPLEPFKFTMNPRMIYRGIGASLFNEVGVTGIQFFITGLTKHILSGNVGSVSSERISAQDEMAAALVGGAIGALFSSPVELVMIQQQSYGTNTKRTLQNIVAKGAFGRHGLGRGFLPAASRDAIYVGGMLGVSPILQDWLMDNTNWGISGTGLVASLVGGAFAALLSAPIDTVKTCMQSDLQGNMYGGIRQTFKTVHSRGVSKFFNGAMWRAVNITGTIILVNEFRMRVAPLMFPHRFKTTSVY